MRIYYIQIDGRFHDSALGYAAAYQIYKALRDVGKRASIVMA
jgi:hypothetical protein